MNKHVTLLLIVILIVSSLILAKAEPVSAATPSVPEFTLKLVEYSHDVRTTYHIDPYTGDRIAIPGYHVQKSLIEVTIKSQHFTPYFDRYGNRIQLKYVIEVKRHSEENWDGADYRIGIRDSENPVTQLSLNYSSFEKLDFRVKAVTGYDHYVYTAEYPEPVFETIESSGWSNTQTITIGENQTPSPVPTSTPEPTSTPTSTLYSQPQSADHQVILGLAITVAVLAVGLGLLLYLVKSK